MTTQAELHLRVLELEETIERGLTKKELRLRDEFAMHAMSLFSEGSNEHIARNAYLLADNMIKVRAE